MNTTTLPSDLSLDAMLGNRTVSSASGRRFSVLNPATEENLGDVAYMNVEEALKALELAETAWHEWEETPLRQRSEVLHDIYRGLVDRTEDFARVITLEMGKPYAEAVSEVRYAADYFRWFGEEAVRLPGRYSSSPNGQGNFVVTRRPVGPVLAITPWNFPIAMAARKLAAALAAGCPVILKPAAETPLTLLLLGTVLREVFVRRGAPDGLVSILPTLDDAEFSRSLMADSRLRKVTFTGSTPVGRILVAQSADLLVHTSMELGGNAPFIVDESADLARAVDGVMPAKIRNGGQACVAANRMYVHASLYREFIDQLVRSFSSLVVGNGLDAATTLGPIISERQRDRIVHLVDSALTAGATTEFKGEVPDGPGFFYPPTILSGVSADAEIVREEIFGPVATVLPFDSREEAVALANDTEFGLAAYAYAESADAVQHYSRRLEAGMIGLNRSTISDAAAPFGGMKQSGFGREGGTEGIEDYLDIQYLAMP